MTEGAKSLKTQGHGTLPATSFDDKVDLPERFRFRPVH